MELFIKGGTTVSFYRRRKEKLGENCVVYLETFESIGAGRTWGHLQSFVIFLAAKSDQFLTVIHFIQGNVLAAWTKPCPFCLTVQH